MAKNSGISGRTGMLRKYALYPYDGIRLLWKSLSSSQQAYPRDFFLFGNAKRIGTKRMKDLPVFHK
jgi:hypothetical protein